jgi:hypothetical protein
MPMNASEMNAEPEIGARTRGFALVADDFAMTPAVTRGILRLAEAGRINATGAMTNRPAWPEAARALRGLAGRLDLGLHLNLTAGQALTGASALAPGGALPRLAPLIARGLAGRLPLPALAAEIEAQLDAFEQAMGRMPDFIDGHQHVHAMPGIRRALRSVLLRRYSGAKPWLRDAGDRLAAIRARRVEARKAALVAALTRPFARAMREAGFRLNAGFAGFSAFDPAADYAAQFRTYLVAPGARHLVMCHPGEVDDELRALDPATGSRPNEIAFFLSERFAAICAEAGLRPARFSEL